MGQPTQGAVQRGRRASARALLCFGVCAPRATLLLTSWPRTETGEPRAGGAARAGADMQRVAAQLAAASAGAARGEWDTSDDEMAAAGEVATRQVRTPLNKARLGADVSTLLLSGGGRCRRRPRRGARCVVGEHAAGIRRVSLAYARIGADEAELRRRLFEARRKAFQGRHRAAEKEEHEALCDVDEKRDAGAPGRAGAA